MALPPPNPQRQLRHRRHIELEVFERDDGLWEVDAKLTDTKPFDLTIKTGLRPANVPVHELLLRLVVDTSFNVIDAGSHSEWVPYPGHCGEHGDAYRQLIGLNLVRGFRHDIKKKLTGVLGCTHLTELAQLLPTAVVQAFAGTVFKSADGNQLDSNRPFQLDRCHALRSDGEVARIYYPRWYQRPASASADTAQASANVPVAAPASLSPTAEQAP